MYTQLPRALLGLSAFAAVAHAEETVLGTYIFHRHGDRTAKAWKPVNLTALGADEVHSSGEFYRKRYLSDDADTRIKAVSSDIVVLSQLEITSSVDAVLHNSALTFAQGLYPPSGQKEKLANGEEVEAPLDGYQYIPIDAVEDAATTNKAESNAWLQGGSGCPNAEISSNNYLSSKEYKQMLDSTKDFYAGLAPVTKGTYGEDDLNFGNAYSIFDLINVARIHNSSIPSEDLLTNSTVDKLYQYASTQQWNLAFNESDPVRAISGSILGGQIVDALDAIINGTSGTPKINAQFGAYGTFMSFFGLAQLNKVDNDFYGVCDYASSMAFELVTNATDPKADDISVRFLFSNGTAAENDLKVFPLFGQDETLLPWSDFKSEMAKISISDDEHWCKLCGSTDDKCSTKSDDSDDDSGDDDASTTSSDSDDGISKPVAGVIGALVTLAVILGLEALIMLVGGYRLVRKSTLAKQTSTEVGNPEK